MGQSVGDRLREVADRLDAKGEDLKEGAKAALGRVAAQLEAIADKVEAGEDVEDGGPVVDNTLPGQ